MISRVEYSDDRNNYFISIKVLNSRISKTLSDYYSEHSDSSFDEGIITSLWEFRRIRKIQKRKIKDNEVYKKFIENLSKFNAKDIIQFSNKYDCVFAYNFKDNVSLITIKLSKSIRGHFLPFDFYFKYHISLPENFSTNDEDLIRNSLLCFDNLKIINSINDFLPFIYKSNLVRYEERFSKIYNFTKDYVKNNRKILISDFYGVYDEFSEILKQCEILKSDLNNFKKERDIFSNEIVLSIISKCKSFSIRLYDLLSLVLSVLKVKNEKGILKQFYDIKFSRRDDVVFYRGVTNFNYKTLPKLFRSEEASNNEDNNFREFKLRFPNEFNGKTLVESVTLMQHYGCSTRLIDITTNPLVALFMASYNGFSSLEEKDKLGEVILFYPQYDLKNSDDEVKFYDSNRINSILSLALLDVNDKDDLFNTLKSVPKQFKNSVSFFMRFRSKEISEMKDLDTLSVELKQELIKAKHIYQQLICLAKREKYFSEKGADPFDLMKSYYLKTPLNNDRIRAQSGCFIVCGLDQDYVEYELKNSRNKGNSTRLIIKDKTNILNELEQINIHQGTMMPDMENVAKFLYGSTKNEEK